MYSDKKKERNFHDEERICKTFHSGDVPADPRPVAEQEAAAPESYTFTDDMGNEVTVNDPQRVVACMGSFANTWELAGGTLVGVSDDAFTFDNFDIASPDVQSVGDFASRGVFRSAHLRRLPTHAACFLRYHGSR